MMSLRPSASASSFPLRPSVPIVDGCNGMPCGFAPRQIMSTYEIGDTFKAHSEYFQLTKAQEVGFYRNAVNASKEITETIYAPYVRFDTRLSSLSVKL